MLLNTKQVISETWFPVNLLASTETRSPAVTRMANRTAP